METIDFKLISIKKNERILDLGCGEGRHTIASEFHFPNAHCIGVDLNFKAIHIAKEKNISFMNNMFSKEPKSSYLQSSAFSLPFNNESFDHIICSEVLEHIVDYKTALNEMNRVLKPGGKLYISVPRYWPEKICWFLSCAYHQVKGGHVHIFKVSQLKKDITILGFKAHYKHWAHALHTPYWWLRCAKWNNGDENKISKLYHKILVWDLIKKPTSTRILEKIINPLMGKSVVMYFTKNNF